jgi:serine phosphatase RsbU (regulator of sigma subunit)/tetratricopeptide (TPR) repeat protein
MMKHLLFILFLAQHIVFANNVDSLKTRLDNVEGKPRINILIELMKAIGRDNVREVILHGNEALALLKEHPDQKTETEVLFLKGWTYTLMNKSDSARVTLDLMNKTLSETENKKGRMLESFLNARILRNENKYEDALTALQNAQSINDDLKETLYKIRILNEFGSVYRRLSRFTEALEVHNKALAIFDDFSDDGELTTTFVLLGIINDVLGNYDKALYYHHQALELNRKVNDAAGIAGSLHNIGILYQKIEKYDQALEYYNKALKYWEDLNNKNGLSSTYNSIGAVNELTGNYTEALKYYQMSLKIMEETGSKFSIAIPLNNIGSIYEKLGVYDQAVTFLQRAIELRESVGDKNGTASSMISLAIVYNKQGKSDLAIRTAKKGLEIVKQTGGLSSIREAHSVLSEIYEDNGLFKEALIEFKNYKAVHDSMFNSESQEVIAELQEKYKSEEQNQQIEILKKQSEIDNLYRTLLMGGFLFVLLTLVLLYNRYRHKQRAHHALKQLHETEIERANLLAQTAVAKAAIMQTEYDQKKKELDAARDLQLSMLPSKLPDNNNVTFSALMLTATEVGGDYYDFFEGDDGSITIAIGDATGHGAQAGIIVTAAKSLFNLLSGEKNISDILRKSNYAIRKMQFTNLFMAFAVLRLKDDVLEFAGAGMPPALIYRAETKEIESLSLKGLPFGSVTDHNYLQASVKLNKGDIVALVSDGFPELFNSKQESLGFEIIPKLLEETGEKSPDEIISHFRKTADEWLDGTKQHDDITFVVMKMNA